ncbi:MAG: MFS transporter [Gammaproteobacteria bacterium]|nr:MFS transporter [Gammaproteobacteria bacterium]
MADKEDSSSAWTNRSFQIYIGGSIVSLHGLWIYRVALGWYAWELTQSEFWVGVVTFTQFAPVVLFGPLFGVLADRFDRQAASVFINSLSVMNNLLLALLTALGNMDIYVLSLFALMQGTLDGAHMPVRLALVPNIVSKAQLQSAIATNSIAFNVSRFIGPAIAGFVIAWKGVAAAFALNAVSYVALLIAVLSIELRPSEQGAHQRSNVWQEMKDGFSYVLQHKAIRALLAITAVSACFGRGPLEMLPAFADAVFQRGASGLATLTAAVGAGAIVGGVMLARGPTWLRIRIVGVLLVIGGLLNMLLAEVTAFAAGIAVVTLLGFVLSLVGVGSQILLQSTVADQIRGRVSGIWGIMAFGGTAFGGLGVGIAASIWGLGQAVLVTGFLCALFAALAGVRLRSFREAAADQE